MKEIVVDSNIKPIHKDSKKIADMLMVKYLAAKKCYDTRSSASNIVVFGKSEEWYTIKEDEVRYLIDKLNNK